MVGNIIILKVDFNGGWSSRPYSQLAPNKVTPQSRSDLLFGQEANCYDQLTRFNTISRYARQAHKLVKLPKTVKRKGKPATDKGNYEIQQLTKACYEIQQLTKATMKSSNSQRQL